jgi:hypothetical protein
MRIGPPPSPVPAQALSVHLTHAVRQVEAHRSSPTARPVEAITQVVGASAPRRVSPHTLDIRA